MLMDLIITHSPEKSHKKVPPVIDTLFKKLNI